MGGAKLAHHSRYLMSFRKKSLPNMNLIRKLHARRGRNGRPKENRCQTHLRRPPEISRPHTQKTAVSDDECNRVRLLLFKAVRHYPIKSTGRRQDLAIMHAREEVAVQLCLKFEGSHGEAIAALLQSDPGEQEQWADVAGNGLVLKKTPFP